MSNPDRYQLQEQLSENELTRSWRAVNRQTGQVCFVKNLAKNPGVDRQTAISLLSRSFDLQKSIRCSRILTARSILSTAEDIYIEYPYADPAEWRPMSPDVFWANSPECLTQIALSIDLLHLLRLVHLDLKLENFQVRMNSGSPFLRMVDLDFLVEAGSSVGGTIMGTPDHIAPEVSENQVVMTSTDNFSLGRSVGNWLQSDRTERARRLQESIEKLVATLTDPDPVQRPRFVLDSLLRCGVIDDSRYQDANRSLLAFHLLNNFRTQRTKGLRNKGAAMNFFTVASRVLGLNEELLQDIDQGYLKNRTATFKLVRAFIKKAEIRHYGIYWQVQASEDLLDRAYCSLDEITGVYRVGVDPQSQQISLNNFLRERIGEASTAGQYLKAYLFARRLSLLPDVAVDRETVNGHPLVIELADLASRFRLDHLAVKHLQQAVSLLPLESPFCQDAFLRLVTYYLSVIQYEAAELLFDRVFTGDVGGLPDEFVFECRRIRTFITAARGGLDEAEKELLTLQSESSQLNSPNLQAGIFGSLGTVQWRRGNYAKAGELYREAYEIAKRAATDSVLVAILGNLASLSYENGEFAEAIKYNRLGIEAARSPAALQRVTGHQYNLLLGYIATGEFSKAEYWLHRQLLSIAPGGDKNAFVMYYFVRGVLQKNQGAYRDAAETFTLALDIRGPLEPERNTGKIYMNLAEIATMQGSYAASHTYAKTALRIYRDLGDSASAIELEYLEKLNDYCASHGSSASALVDSFRALLDRECRHYSAHCLFHILLSGHDESIRRSLALSESFIPYLIRSSGPMFRAAGVLALAMSDCTADGHFVTSLKSAFTILNAGHNLYMCALVAQAIADQYLRSGKEKLAAKFLQQARKQADAMPNRELVTLLDTRLATLQRADANQARLLESVHGISEVLRQIESYDEALVQIVQYAVDQTGAERGVLLLGHDQSSGLEVKASLNCDEQSLQDIRDFSRNAPGLAARERQSLIIENALEDKRTRRYQSVVMHNILSIICVPITLGDNLYGVLYLDHHTIPALFEENDVRYVQSLSNFLAVMLATLYKFRSVDTRKKQLENDLSRLGAHKSLVTRNAAMMAMLSKIPVIARSSTPVLVMGENGTGKEVLCELIHLRSLRSSLPLVKLNCAAIAESLIESELFGVAKNTATGVAEREGKFSAADSGTLILDEIGDMPLEIQAKVLRVLEYQKFEKVGSNRTISTDIRFLYATNKDLKALIREGRFRQDLYYRISTIVIEIPPLRERPDDIELLVQHFLKLFARHDAGAVSFSSKAIDTLVRYHWPGNVRELRNLVERYCLLYAGKTVDIADLPREIQDQDSGDLAIRHTDAVEKARIIEALDKANWNQSKAARALKMPLSTLRRKIVKYSISRYR